MNIVCCYLHDFMIILESKYPKCSQLGNFTGSCAVVSSLVANRARIYYVKNKANW